MAVTDSNYDYDPKAYPTSVAYYEVPCVLCGGIFCLYTRSALPVGSDPVSYKHMMHLDGSWVLPSEDLRCDTCGKSAIFRHPSSWRGVVKSLPWIGTHFRTDGDAPIFRQDVNGSVLVDREFPERLVMTKGLLNTEPYYIETFIRIKCANGRAMYQVVGWDDNLDQLYCRRVDGKTIDPCQE